MIEGRSIWVVARMLEDDGDHIAKLVGWRYSKTAAAMLEALLTAQLKEALDRLQPIRDKHQKAHSDLLLPKGEFSTYTDHLGVVRPSSWRPKDHPNYAVYERVIEEEKTAIAEVRRLMLDPEVITGLGTRDDNQWYVVIEVPR